MHEGMVLPILAAVRAKLGQSASHRLDAQLQYLPYRQRQDGGRILAFFPGKRNPMPAEILFDNTQELCFAVVELRRLKETDKLLTAQLYAVNRRFFSIEYDMTPSLKGFQDGTQTIVTNVRINADLETPQSTGKNGS